MEQTTLKPVPLLDLLSQYEQIQSEIESAVIETLRSGHYVLGPRVKNFEQSASEFLGTKHAIGCANGSDAIYIALLALDIKPGDEVITTPFTYVATAEAITQAGAVPVFADIDINTFNIKPYDIEAKIGPKTRAIIVVHLYGQACEMTEIMEIARRHGLRVIEDTAQSFGTMYKNQSAGTIGDIGTYSFYPTKNLSCAGDGGMLTTNSDELNERLRKIRAHGSARRYYHDELGVNSRLDEIQAAILEIKLKHIKNWNLKRAKLAKKYNETLSGVEFEGCKITTPALINNSTHIYHQYTIRLSTPKLSLEHIETKRNALKEKLASQGISSEIYYPLPLHMQKIYLDLGLPPNAMPNSLLASKSILCLPIYPELSNSDQDRVIEAITQ
jgi:dTDP-4-amino-4,6-dideoxygalactose transaminase